MRPIKIRSRDIAAAVEDGGNEARRFGEAVVKSQIKSVDAMRGPRPSRLNAREHKRWKQNEKTADEIEGRLNSKINQTRESLTLKTLELEGCIAQLGVYTHMHDAATLARANFVTKLVNAQKYINQQLLEAESELLVDLPAYKEMLDKQQAEGTLSETETEQMFETFKQGVMARIIEVRREIEKSFDVISREALGTDETPGIYR